MAATTSKSKPKTKAKAKSGSTSAKSKSNSTKPKSQSKSQSKSKTGSQAKKAAESQRQRISSAVRKANAKASGSKSKSSGSKSKSSKSNASSAKASTSSASKSSSSSRSRSSSAKRNSSTKSRASSSRKSPAKRSTAGRTTKRRTSASRSRSSSARSQKQPNAVKVRNELVPTLALEEYEPVTEGAGQGVSDQSKGSTKFAWVGAGQCGGRLVKSFYDLGYHKSIALNTAYHDLNDLDLPDNQKILMDIGRKGAGKDPSRGRDAAEQYRQDIIHAIQRIYATDVNHVMLAFGSGGGTGSGSALPLIDTIRSCAKHIGIRDPQRRIGVLTTLPTDGEAASPKVADNAYQVVSELCRMAQNGEISPLIIVDNEKIARMYPGLTVKDFWPTINTTVAGLYDIFNRLSSLSSPYTAFDSVDYQSIMEAGGCAIMGLTKVDYFHRRYDISEAMKSNLQKTLLASGFDMSTAKVVGAVVIGGKQIMSQTPGLQDSINYAFDVLTDLTGNATVHRGIYEDNKESLRVYTIIGGLATPHERLEELKRVM